ncbi:MAG: MgtC/SapB family protein [Candidatus Omnitrophica bacterium]|nr:MgtC/SapB family protein [Candidatus Omnitrophota bacterium]MBU1127526.1 MgtC/SapB family protein [Candidatus Omnitrophota bacterium]MBU1783818.1 MgtC/SapB family protein [Candidatus Omnitrophota bacterium]MBU1851405.1 MgtC/SapB family protein [Candidatus Omnitrophota bacterium]
MSILVITLRILLSAALSGVIGLERETHDKAAGLRTHMLVCVGSAIFMIISLLLSLQYGHFGPVDPSRIASGVVTGVGFLGAGAVMRSGASVHGLTTAASIWAVAAIGLAVGAGLYAVGIVGTAVVILVLVLSGIKKRFGPWKDKKAKT